MKKIGFFFWRDVFECIRIGVVVLACSFPCFASDHGSNAASASAVSFGVGNLGIIEMDVDQDWFSFVAQPSAAYDISVTTGTLWDSSIEVVAPDGSTAMRATSSVNASLSRIVWTNAGTFGKYYVRVGGFAEFTTGSYDIVVVETNRVDVDGDGMDDNWELGEFGTLTNDANGDVDGDGFSNIDEHYLVSNPNDPNSGLFVSMLETGAVGTVVAWDAASNGTYRLSAASNLLVESWREIGTSVNLDGSEMESIIDGDSSSSTSQFYRVELFF